MPKSYRVMFISLSYVYGYQGYKVRRVVTFFVDYDPIIKFIACA